MSAVGFPVATTGELVNALEEAIERVRSCDFTLPEPWPAAADVRVQLADLSLAQSTLDGWDMPEPGRIRLHGSACQGLKTSSASVTLQPSACP